jgi:pimeloyl-ACP methyl ester carboxylesterase
MQRTPDRDGYLLHYSAAGSGPRIVWVDPALASSSMRPLHDAVELLAERFEVVTYDRRGRGRNTPVDTLSAEQEVADLHALLTHLRGASAVLGFSSGGALALRAARGLRTDAVVLLEPAVVTAPDESGLRGLVADALARGDAEGAVLAFYEATGVPQEIVADVRASAAWPAVVRSAPTLLADIDLTVADEGTFATPLDQPVHVILSTGSPEEIVAMSEDLARRLDAPLWREPGGWHGVEPSALSKRLAAVLSFSQGSRP